MFTYDEVIAAAGGVIEFQKKAGLVADGVAGPTTNNAVLRVMLGLAPLRRPSDNPGKDGIRRPAMDETYGAFKFEHYPKEKVKANKDKGRVIIDPTWEAENIVEKKLWDGQVLKLHKDCWDEFNFIFKAAVEASGYHPKYIVGYKPRHTLWDPAKSLSTHSWGCAVDFEPDNNDMGGVDVTKPKGADGKYPPSRMRRFPKFPETFKFFGWAYGGDFSVRDDMHLSRTIS